MDVVLIKKHFTRKINDVNSAVGTIFTVPITSLKHITLQLLRIKTPDGPTYVITTRIIGKNKKSLSMITGLEQTIK